MEDEKAGGKRQDAKSYYKTVGVNFVSGGVTENKQDEVNNVFDLFAKIIFPKIVGDTAMNVGITR